MDPRPPTIIGHGSERTRPAPVAVPTAHDVLEDSAIVVDMTLDECMQILDETVRHLYSHHAPTAVEWCAIAGQLDVVRTTLQALVTSPIGKAPHLRPA
jgi:hypothetical protein